MPDFFTVTVSQVTRRLSMIVKGDKALNDLYVSGEISNFTLHKASGHMYFTLKDETASIKCVMFAGNARSLDFTPYSGQSVIVHGSVNVYERDGANQIYVTDMIERGQGELALAYEQAKRELEAGGYFNKKRPIPKQPKKVCLITAEKGAALQDMLNIIARRRPILEVVFIPVTVQGAYAPSTLIKALALAQSTGSDLIIIGRGGGSAEDLSCFNDVGYAKALYNSEIPTISAVGHETDFTLCDFAADIRASTPSVAAEMVTADNVKLALFELSRKMSAAVTNKLSGVFLFSRETAGRLIAGLSAKELKLKNFYCNVGLRLLSGTEKKELAAESAFTTLSRNLKLASPLGILERGYAVVRKDGEKLFSPCQVKKGDDLEIILRDGKIKASVETE